MPGANDRADRLRAVVEDCLRRRAAGEVVDHQAVIAALPDLQPELERELALLRLIERARAASRSRSGLTAPAAPLSDASPLPDELESYNFVREIHRGGQGVVYEAIQRSTGRRVAVKVRRESFFGDRRDTERFQREVEILAQLQHPSIVGVIDSGVHDGSVYYVMDYVDGVPIDEFLASRRLEVREVLRLFEKITAAVNAAHLRGVIHRDLKPANILIDGAGEPHLLDFGLARLTGELTDAVRAGRTVTGQFVGSLPWASPEQAEGVPAKIDLRTDVYSLGMVLFQMLTGRMPYRVDDSHAAEGLRGALSVIMNAVPPRPSTLRKGIDADLDTITLKCLSKERQRRYQSAGELAEDIRRYLADRPISARPPSLRYQLRRFARRNRPVVIAAAAIGLALTVGAVGTLVQLFRARGAERLAESRRVEAEQKAYVASIYAADAAVRGNDGPAARARLAAAPAALRGWEWRYLTSLTDRSRGALKASAPVTSLVSAGPDGAIGIADTGELRRWRVEDGRVEWTAAAIRPLSEPRAAMRISRDGSRLIVINPTQAAVYDTSDGRELRRWDLGEKPVLMCGVLTPDGHAALIAGRASFGLHRLDVQTGEDRLINEDFLGNVRDIDINLDASRLATIEHPHILLRDGSSGAIVRKMPNSAPEFSGGGQIRFSPDGSLIAATLASAIRLYQSDTLKVSAELHGHPLLVRSIEFSPDGSRLASCGDDASIRIWSLGSQESEVTLLGHDAAVLSVCWNGDNAGLLSAGAEERGPRPWRLDDARSASRAPLRRGEQPLGFSGEDLLLESTDRTRILRRKLDGTSPDIEVLRLPSPAIGDLSLSGSQGACITDQRDLRVFNLNTGESRVVATLPANAGARPVVAPYFTTITSDGTLVTWSAPHVHALHVVDTRTGAEVFTASIDGLELSHSAFTPDSQRLICCYRDHVTVYDTRSWRQVSRLDSSDKNLSGISVSADSRLATVVDRDGHMIVFEVETGVERVSRRIGAGPQFLAVFSPDGRRLASGGEDRLVRIIDPDTGEALLSLRGHKSLIMGMMWSDSGAQLITLSHDGEALIWDADAASDAATGRP